MSIEHVVSRINEHYYKCLECGAAGSERWAILHQFPMTRAKRQLRTLADCLIRRGGIWN